MPFRVRTGGYVTVDGLRFLILRPLTDDRDRWILTRSGNGLPGSRGRLRMEKTTREIEEMQAASEANNAARDLSYINSPTILTRKSLRKKWNY